MKAIMRVIHDNTSSTTVNRVRSAARWVLFALGGLGVWTAVTLISAIADPRADGAGLVGAFNSMGAWLTMGLCLTAVAMVATAAYRRRSWRMVKIAAAMVIGTALVFMAVSNLQLIGGLLLSLIAITGTALCMRKGVETDRAEGENDLFDDGDGWRYGVQGYGYYIQGMRYMGPIGDNES